MAVKSCIKWIGGKSRNADKYINLMPKHSVFVSPFCGACHVELAKGPVRYELVNDKNDKLINFLMVLRDRPKELYDKCAGLPYAESLYYFYRDTEFQDPLEKAVAFYYIVRAGFGGGGHKNKTGFSVSITQNTSKLDVYYSALELIESMAKRIKHWHILSRDFEDVIERYDSKGTFFFCDPPYVNCEDLYAGGFAKEDHYRLKNILANIKGKAMVCYYEDPLVDELYSDWFRDEYTAKSKIQARDFGEECPERTELILMNYRPIDYEQLKIV